MRRAAPNNPDKVKNAFAINCRGILILRRGDYLSANKLMQMTFFIMLQQLVPSIIM